MHNSVIMSYRAKESSFKVVVEKITKAELPVVTRYDDNVMHFEYNGKCDGNTSLYLEQIIQGLIGLYKS